MQSRGGAPALTTRDDMPKVLILGATGGKINGHASHASASR